MNVPQIYLIEPYNAYAPKGGRKKHWTEIAEEQALLEKILAEASNRSLPQNAPEVSTPTVVGNTSGQGQTGGGGVPLTAFFSPRMTVNFSPSATTASAPSQLLFSNTSNPDLLAQGVATFLWSFGDGTTSTEINPLKTFSTTSSAFPVTLKATSIATGVTASVTQSIQVNPPVVTANFSVSSGSTSGSISVTGSAPVVVQFTNLTTTDNSQNSISYLWTFGSGSNGTSSLANPTFTYTATGSYTVRLAATGSFSISSSKVLIAVLATT